MSLPLWFFVCLFFVVGGFCLFGCFFHNRENNMSFLPTNQLPSVFRRPLTLSSNKNYIHEQLVANYYPL